MQGHFAVLGGPDLGVRLHWTAWGNARAARTVVCVHGLTRNGRDFDDLAAGLAATARVLCVDVAGRGLSDRLERAEDYAVPVYARQLCAWLDGLASGKVDWVGTSMGGLIGMAVAAASPGRIGRLVLNDVGPVIPRAALAAIGSYVGLDPLFATLGELEAHLRAIHAPFGPLTDAQWRHLAAHGGRRCPGGWRLRYDPAIRLPFAAGAQTDVDLWPVYDAISTPTLVLRGGDSTLLDAGTARAMTARGPRARLVEFPGIGHAPALMDPAQIAVLRDFLAG